ncbi:unnamed protein product [Trichobilharzia regenti]|nr:unnamed protein product [Trichobilharzia regenti]
MLCWVLVNYMISYAPIADHVIGIPSSWLNQRQSIWSHANILGRSPSATGQTYNNNKSELNNICCDLSACLEDQKVQKVIRDIVLQLLNEEVPENTHPILSLAKTDQERAEAKKRRQDLKDEEDESALTTADRKKRRIWLRQRNPPETKPIRDTTSHEYMSEFAREKRLRCQATRGTVALFNAVKQHQTNIGKQLEGSKSGFEEEKILTQITTSDFLDRLSAGISSSKSSKVK